MLLLLYLFVLAQILLLMHAAHSCNPIKNIGVMKRHKLEGPGWVKSVTIISKSTKTKKEDRETLIKFFFFNLALICFSTMSG